MTTVEIRTIGDVGRDYVVLQGSDCDLRLEFADDPNFTKENNANFFRPLKGKPAATPVLEQHMSERDMFVAVDMWQDSFRNFKVIPFPFSISNIRILGVGWLQWRFKLRNWKPVRKGLNEACWLCNEIGNYTTYQHPDSSRSQDWAYDICETCVRRLHLPR